MSRKEQLDLLKKQREEIIHEIESFYLKIFDRVSELNLNERDIAKLSQLILQSKDGAITPMQKEIEKQLITQSNN